MRVLVCGGRNYADQQRVSDVLLEIGATYIIHGMAAGADDLADNWAHANHVNVMPFPADWGTFGKAAGPIRNAKMLRDGKPQLVVAFPGGKGTANMIAQAKAAGIPVKEIK